jgi:hypothetical protein
MRAASRRLPYAHRRIPIYTLAGACGDRPPIQMPLAEEEARLLESFEFSKSKYLDKKANETKYAPYRRYWYRLKKESANNPEIFFQFGSFRFLENLKKMPPVLQYCVCILCKCIKSEINLGQLTMRKYDESDPHNSIFALVKLEPLQLSIYFDKEKIETVSGRGGPDLYAIFELPIQLITPSLEIPKIASFIFTKEDDSFLLISSEQTDPRNLEFYGDVSGDPIETVIRGRDDYLQIIPDDYIVLYSKEARVKLAYELLWKDFPSW